MAVKNILPTNLKNPNLGVMYDTGAKPVCKWNVKENHNESSKYIPNEESLENITASDFNEAVVINVTTEVNNSMVCINGLADFNYFLL